MDDLSCSDNLALAGLKSAIDLLLTYGEGILNKDVESVLEDIVLSRG